MLNIKINDEPTARHFGDTFLDSSADVVWIGQDWPQLRDFTPSNPEQRWDTSHYGGELSVPAELAVRLLADELAAICELCDLRIAQKAKQVAEWEEQRCAHEVELASAAALAVALSDARLLLAEELKDGRTAKANLRIVSEFLAAIPTDALRGTVKRLAGSHDIAAELMAKIEDASPVHIFKDDGE